MSASVSSSPSKRLLCRSHPRHCGPKSQYPQKYTHWLPEAFPLEDLDETALGDTTLNNYSLFEGLVHATHLRDAVRIVEDKEISCRAITDHTVANAAMSLWPEYEIPEEYRCLYGKTAVWIAPDCSTSYRFGPIVFNLSICGNEGIWRLPSDFHYYWIETIDYHKTEAASRILVSRREIKSLKNLSYNPEYRGGPWYYDKQTKKHYCLKKSRNFEGNSIRNHTLEFVRLKGFSWPHEILGWTTIKHSDCKKYKNRCLESNLQIEESGLRFLLHTVGEKVVSEKVDEDCMQTIVKFFCRRSFATHPISLDPPGSDNINIWRAVISCIKDGNFDSAFYLARTLSVDYLKQKLNEWGLEVPESLIKKDIEEQDVMMSDGDGAMSQIVDAHSVE